jgi:hypothetical protein
MAIDPEEVPLPAAAHTSDSRRIEEFTQQALTGKYGLVTVEEWWRDQSELLLRQGYKVRRRFRKDWVPSWLGRDLDPRYCEDRIMPFVSRSR